ncbi:NAD(P)H-hydrate dehydratase [Methyloligella sp. 2.7D]|uniref:NAD(P)H-hydrate dehydratase n=1 Tax=unclassified Methyloligella TaxID=2625955 RepID=UPI00157E2B5B|nr:NAD(P)H-hydrate dehydratase [Methyloligella sp. GL2]QKP77788.1 NAD(P)H-hydrate dehydratase [Methyloligella sp. GL2]
MLELLTSAEMGNADRLTIEAGTPGLSLMERAGDAIATEVAERFPDAVKVSILCGPGNNGGDGFVAARLLAGQGYTVRVGLLGDAGKLPADAAANAKAWEGTIEPLSADLLDGAEILIDGIFGAGLARPIEGALAELVAAVNASRLPVIAIDVPSGIDGSTGKVRGIAVQAIASVTFFRLKPGHVLLPGRLCCGDVTLAQIGIDGDVLQTIDPDAFLDEPALWLDAFPWPQPDGHKYSRGHLLVVSGREDATGAARLAARGGLRIGVGLVTVASPRDALPVNAAQLTAIMVRPADTADELAELLADTRKNTVVLGPGLGVGRRTRNLVAASLASPAAVVIDADGISSFAEVPETLFGEIKGREAPVVLTPHEGEFARLFPDIAGEKTEPEVSKLERARQAASLSGAIVVLKGSDTVIAAPDGRAAVNATSSPWLATAGTGDVLSGMIGGLLAQHMSGFEAACAAVWFHGAAAEAFGPGLISEDVPEMIPKVLRELQQLV